MRQNAALCGNGLRYPKPEDSLFYRVISVISVVQGETTLTISDSIVEPVSMESEIVRLVSLSTREIFEIAGLKSDLQGPDALMQKVSTQVSLRSQRRLTLVDTFCYF